MKILYYSLHAILEYDEVSLFQDLGHTVFPLGIYFKFERSQPFRPHLKGMPGSEALIAAFDQSGCAYASGARPEDIRLTPEFVDLFDVVVVMHDLDFIARHWEVLSRRPVVWRTIGQNIDGLEIAARPFLEGRRRRSWFRRVLEGAIRPFRRKGLHIVRYSPAEQRNEDYCGHDAIIRFGKDPDAFAPWTGAGRNIVTFANTFAQRYPVEFSLYRATLDACGPTVPACLGGAGNEGLPQAIGLVDHDAQMRLLREAGVYFYASGNLVPYTLNFIEAWMAGAPLVVLNHPAGKYYEISDLIANNVNGIVTSTPGEAAAAITKLLRDPAAAGRLGQAGRQAAIASFGLPTIRSQWAELLNRIR